MKFKKKIVFRCNTSFWNKNASMRKFLYKHLQVKKKKWNAFEMTHSFLCCVTSSVGHRWHQQLINLLLLTHTHTHTRTDGMSLQTREQKVQQFVLQAGESVSFAPASPVYLQQVQAWTRHCTNSPTLRNMSSCSLKRSVCFQGMFTKTCQDQISSCQVHLSVLKEFWRGWAGPRILQRGFPASHELFFSGGKITASSLENWGTCTLSILILYNLIFSLRRGDESLNWRLTTDWRPVTPDTVVPPTSHV